jgi:hypothetical protein
MPGSRAAINAFLLTSMGRGDRQGQILDSGYWMLDHHFNLELRAKFMVRAWLIFTLCSLHLFISQLYRTTNAVLAPWLIKDLYLDTEGLGLLSAGFFYAFALTQIPISIFLDQLGAKRLMIALSFVGMAGIMFSLAHGLGMGLAGRLLLGVGMACNLMGPWLLRNGFPAPSRRLPACSTRLNPRHIVAATPLVLLVEQFGWRLSFQAVIAVHLLLTLTLFWVVQDRPAEKAFYPPPSAGGLRPAFLFGNLRILMHSKDYWIISAGTFVRYGTHAALQTLWAGPSDGGHGVFTVRGNILLTMNPGYPRGLLWVAFRPISDPQMGHCRRIADAGADHLHIEGPAAGDKRPARGGYFPGLWARLGQRHACLCPHQGSRSEGHGGRGHERHQLLYHDGPGGIPAGPGHVMQSLYPRLPRPEAFGTALLICAVARRRSRCTTRSNQRFSSVAIPPGLFRSVFSSLHPV